MAITLSDELRREKLLERLIDRPNDVKTTVELGENVLQGIRMEITTQQAYYLCLYRLHWCGCTASYSCKIGVE